MTGPQDAAKLDGITQILIAPGVPRSIPLLREAARRRIPVQVDVDFLYPLMADKRVVAITGTDGKTYPATKPKPKPENADKDETVSATQPEPKPEKDALRSKESEIETEDVAEETPKE